jgi:hypothetical protein
VIGDGSLLGGEGRELVRTNDGVRLIQWEDPDGDLSGAGDWSILSSVLRSGELLDSERRCPVLLGELLRSSGSQMLLSGDRMGVRLPWRVSNGISVVSLPNKIDLFSLIAWRRSLSS